MSTLPVESPSFESIVSEIEDIPVPVAVSTEAETRFLTEALDHLALWIKTTEESRHNPDKDYRGMRAAQLAVQLSRGYSIVVNELMPRSCGAIFGVDSLLVDKAVARQLDRVADQERISALSAIQELLNQPGSHMVMN